MIVVDILLWNLDNEITAWMFWIGLELQLPVIYASSTLAALLFTVHAAVRKHWRPAIASALVVLNAIVWCNSIVKPLLGAFEIETDHLAGTVEITINSVEDRQGEIGFTFNPDFCGRGLATEAANAALGYGFTRMGLHRIFAGVDVRNERSWRLMERIGMRREAHFIHANLEGEEWIDDFVYAMLNQEWPSLAPTPFP